MAQVILSHISKDYPGPVRAVEDVSLEIADGEFVVLVGPSGCGKSTTLRMIAGLEEITSGTISIGDRVVNEVHPKDRDIAMVFQNYALYPHMTVYRNMAFALTLRKVPKADIDRKVHETARILGIENLLDRKPRQLSGGQRQRVAVGRAIVREPKAFLFDEPLSNLDAKLRVETRAELKALHQRLRTTTVYVTHDQEEAMTLGDRVVIMCGGIVQQVGAPLEVYRQPVNRFVAGFLGMPPMNFIEVKIEGSQGRLWAIEANGVHLPLPDRLGRDAGRLEGRDLVLGIRPEAFSLPDGSLDPGADRFAVELEVKVVEPLGDRMDLFLAGPSGQRLVARVDASSAVKPGGRQTLRIDLERIHLFERGEFGNRLVERERI